MLKTAETDREKIITATERTYGKLPDSPLHLRCKSLSVDESFAAGKATQCQCELLLDLGEREISVPCVSVIPKCGTLLPAIAYLSYEREIPNKYLPAEEIIDRGYAIFTLCINDVTDNTDNFKSGIARHIAPSRRKRLSPGKIALWAWAALRLLEYIDDLECIDKNRVVLAGHGILARAAMLASGNGGNCKYVIANCITENPMPFMGKGDKSGLTVRDFSYLYSPDFADQPDTNELATLLSIASDNSLLFGFSEESEWIPSYDYLCKACGISYLSADEDDKNKIPAVPSRIEKGKLSYHIRQGSDYFSREDWNIYLDFIDKKS